MTKKLEQLFELSSLEPTELTEPLPEQTQEVTRTALDNLEKIDQALPQVRNLDLSDNEFDELSDLAKKTYRDLVDLGMQVESRFSSEIFNAASSFLGHAITAKTAKVQKKLKMIELQIRKASLDAKASEKDKEVGNIPLGTGTAVDRNELLRMMLEKKKEE